MCTSIYTYFIAYGHILSLNIYNYFNLYIQFNMTRKKRFLNNRCKYDYEVISIMNYQFKYADR